MKTCTKCGEEKDLLEFPVDNKNKDGLDCKCRSCQSKRKKIDYDNKKEFVESQKTPCIVCNFYVPVCIDFHHIDESEKEITIANSYRLSYKRLQKEIDKCVCLCSNCHRQVHAGLIDLSAYIATT